MSGDVEPSSSVSINSLPAEDVLYKHILPLLEADDWISLSHTSNNFRTIVRSFLSKNKTISVRPSSNINSQKFKFLTETSTNLRRLEMPKCTWLTDEILKPVLRANNSINIVDLSSCNNLSEGVFQILSVQCIHITHLNLRSCTWVSPESLDYFVYQKKLRLEPRDPDAPMTEDVLKAMGKNLRTDLRARTKSKYGDKDQFYHKLQMKGFKQKHTSNFTKMFPHLLYADLSRCPQIGEKNFENFIKAFNQIQTLKIGHNNNITDTTMKAIAMNLKELQELDISCCYDVTRAGLFTVVKHCKKLQSIGIGDISFPVQLITMIEKAGVRIDTKLPENDLDESHARSSGQDSTVRVMSSFFEGMFEPLQ